MNTLNVLIASLSIVLVSVACAPASAPVEPGEAQLETPAVNENEANTGDQAGEEGTPEADVVGKTWLWERFDDSANLNNIVVEDPSRYTLLLNPDGTYEVQADCNRAGGQYMLEGGGVAFEPGPATLAACEPSSLSETYLERLSAAATYVMDGDRLVLNLWADSGNMVFAPAE